MAAEPDPELASEDAGEFEKNGGLETGPPPREPDPPSEPERHSYQEVNVPDVATADDSLGFEPYVEAMAAFLTNPETRGPLTVSIEGEWGSGKSSFMKQLEKALPDAAKAHAAEPPIIVWFNAWRHDKAEELWAAFALELLREFSEGLPLRERWSNHFRLSKLRFDWRHGWRDGLRFIASFVVPAVAALALPLVVGVDKLTTWIGQGPMEGLAGIGYVGFVVALFLSLRNFNGNPFSIDLRKHIRDLRKHIRRPDYNARVSFIEQFHKDFKKILDAYVGDRKVVCFIDDLDRCEVPKAADLMQAFNLMLSDDPRMIFLLGMDRRKIAAGLAVKFKDLIPFLSEADGAGGTAAGSSPAKPDGGAGLRFGHDFIEKFVQISYSLPRTAEGNLDAFLKGLAPAPPKPKETGEPEKASRSIRPSQWARRLANKLRGKSAQQDGAETSAPARAEAGKDAVEGPSDERGDEGSEERRRRLVRIVEVVKGGEDPAFTNKLVRLVAPAFDYNPRRLKQFINLFRLNVATAGATQVLFAEEETTNLGIRLEQVGKFVALRMRWPEVVEELERSPEQFAAICQWAEGNEEWNFPFRLNRADLLRSLLRAGCEDEKAKTKWGLQGVDVRRLLEVSPAAPAVPEPERSSYQEINVPDDVFAQTGKAEVLKAQGQFEEALAAYEATIKDFPGDVVARNGKAEVLKAQGRFEEALAAYEATIKDFPGDVVARNGKAEVLKAQGRFEEALAAYEATIKGFPDDVLARNGKAEVLKAQRRFEEALAAYEATIKGFPDDVFARNGKAEVLKAQRRFEEALAAYEATIKGFPDDVLARNGKAEVLKAQGRFEEALAAYEATIKDFPDDVLARNGKAEVLKAQGRFEEALAAGRLRGNHQGLSRRCVGAERQGD